MGKSAKYGAEDCSKIAEIKANGCVPNMITTTGEVLYRNFNTSANATHAN